MSAPPPPDPDELYTRFDPRRPVRSVPGYWKKWPVAHPNRILGVALAVCYEARLLTISNSENQFLPVAEIVDYKINDIAPIIKRNVDRRLYTLFLWHAFNIQHHTDG